MNINVLGSSPTVEALDLLDACKNVPKFPFGFGVK
jgi:hypothetical protein